MKLLRCRSFRYGTKSMKVRSGKSRKMHPVIVVVHAAGHQFIVLSAGLSKFIFKMSINKNPVYTGFFIFMQDSV
jgi:hypothetical protein